jgi:alpha-L-fucosidase
MSRPRATSDEAAHVPGDGWAWHSQLGHHIFVEEPKGGVFCLSSAAIDGHSDFGWNGQADQTLWTSTGPPQALTLDLGRPYAGVDTVTYLPGQDTATNWSNDYLTDGSVTAYEVSVSIARGRWTQVARGAWPADHTLKQARFAPVNARYVRLDVLATQGGGPALASEIGCGGTHSAPRPA